MEFFSKDILKGYERHVIETCLVAILEDMYRMEIRRL